MACDNGTLPPSGVVCITRLPSRLRPPPARHLHTQRNIHDTRVAKGGCRLYLAAASGPILRGDAQAELQAAQAQLQSLRKDTKGRPLSKKERSVGDDVRRRLQACSPEAVDADVAALGARLGRHPLVLLLLRAVHAAMRGQMRVNPTQQAAVDEQCKGKQQGRGQGRGQGQGGRPAVGAGAGGVSVQRAQVEEAEASSSDSGSSEDEGGEGVGGQAPAHAGGRQPGEAAPAAAGAAGAAVPKKAAKRAGALNRSSQCKQNNTTR